MAPPKAPNLLLRGLFPSVAPRMGLGDHLVSIRAFEHPWGATQWQVGPSSLIYGPPKSLKIVVCRWFSGIWCAHNLLGQFSTLYRSKMEIFSKFSTLYRSKMEEFSLFFLTF